MFHSSVIEISRSALKENIEFLKSNYDENVKFSSVVKGNAYGHGIEEFVKLAEQVGIDHFSVFSADEALRVMKAAKHKPDIMIMGQIENSDIEWAVRNGIEFYVFERDRLEHALKISDKIEIPAKIHIEFETGMNRTGFEQNEQKKVITLLKDYQKKINLKGYCTHFAGSESLANYVRIMKQKERFKNYVEKFEKNGLKAQRKHTACSAASIRYPETQMDMVRIGILQYGFWPSKETMVTFTAENNQMKDPLKSVLTWKSKVMSTKQVKGGEYIGYGMSFLAEKDMRVAAVPVGYYHGFSRSLSNLGRVLIKGSRLSVVGLVNMNVLLVDISYCDNINKNDEVVIIGKQNDKDISVSAFGELSTQLNYELLTRIPLDIPRKIVN